MMCRNMVHWRLHITLAGYSHASCSPSCAAAEPEAASAPAAVPSLAAVPAAAAAATAVAAVLLPAAAALAAAAAADAAPSCSPASPPASASAGCTCERHTGQSGLDSSHVSTQAAWKVWPQPGSALHGKWAGGWAGEHRSVALYDHLHSVCTATEVQRKTERVRLGCGWREPAGH